MVSRIYGNKDRRFTFKELAQEYREETGKKTGRRTLQKQLKTLPEHIQIERKDQLWISYRTNVGGNDLSMQPNKMGILKHRNKGANLIHSSHKWRFSIKYQGQQPLKGANQVNLFGRYKTAKQAFFYYKDITVVAFKKKLNVWIHRPSGKFTQNQAIEAREKAYLALLQFSREHEITLEGNIKDLMLSHHVVEHPALNTALKPVFAGREEEIDAAIGSHVCHSSHPGKIEHTGIPGRITGYQVGKNLEYLCTQFPSDFSILARENAAFRENLITHLRVMQEMSDTLKKIREEI